MQMQQQQYIPQAAPDMPDMRGIEAPQNKRTAAAKQQQDDEDGGWGDAGGLLD
jgi:hypothetical protein